MYERQGFYVKDNWIFFWTGFLPGEKVSKNEKFQSDNFGRLQEFFS